MSFLGGRGTSSSSSSSDGAKSVANKSQNAAFDPEALERGAKALRENQQVSVREERDRLIWEARGDETNGGEGGRSEDERGGRTARDGERESHVGTTEEVGNAKSGTERAVETVRRRVGKETATGGKRSGTGEERGVGEDARASGGTSGGVEKRYREEDSNGKKGDGGV